MADRRGRRGAGFSRQGREDTGGQDQTSTVQPRTELITARPVLAACQPSRFSPSIVDAQARDGPAVVRIAVALRAWHE